MNSLAGRLLPGLGGAVSWWTGELRDLLPATLRDRRRRRADAELQMGSEGWSLRHRSGRVLTLSPGDGPALTEAAALVRGRRRRGKVTLVVPLARCLVRRSELPRRMLGRAGAILASELEVNTPFVPGSVHWDWFAAEAGMTPGSVIVEQVILKRRDTEALLAALARHGLAAMSILVENTATARRLPVDLTRHDQSGAADSPSLRGPRRVLLVTAVVAGLAIVPAAFQKQSAQLAALDAEIADATDAVALRPGLPRVTLQRLGEALAAKRSYPAAAFLDSLAASLPADSHLTHILLDTDIATVQGRTGSLHGLERAMANPGLLTVGHNTAPPDKSGDGLPFTVRLKLRPVPARDPGR